MTWDELSRLRWAEGDHPGIVIEPDAPTPSVEKLRAIFAESAPKRKPAMRRAPVRTKGDPTP